MSIRVKGQLIRGNFGQPKGDDRRKERNVYREDGTFLGTITKVTGGYRVERADGKVREKKYLEEAFKTCARSN